MSCWLGTHAPRAIGGGVISRSFLRSREMPDTECPGSILQMHPDCILVADEEALSLL